MLISVVYWKSIYIFEDTKQLKTTIMRKQEMIIATPNQSKRTFTLRTTLFGRVISKHRTMPMSKDEFEDCEMNTSNDWKDFLRNEEVLSLN